MFRVTAALYRRYFRVETHGIETLPVIMFSGESEDDHAEEHGANTFVGKPLDPLALVEQAKALLRVRVTQFG